MFSMSIDPERHTDVSNWFLLLCVIIALLGQLVRIIAVGFAADGTSGRNTKRHVADEINQTGIYSLLRNPLYLGNLLMWMGPALFTRIWWLVFAFMVIFWLYYERIILAEENYLHNKFGAAYQSYADRVNCLLPSLKQYKPNQYRFRVKKALRQEYSGVYALFWVFTVVELLRNLFIYHRIVLSRNWIATGIILTAAYIAIRLLKKRTHYLDKEQQRKKLNHEE